MGVRRPWVGNSRRTAALTVVALLAMTGPSYASINVTITGEGVTEEEAETDAIKKAFVKILDKIKPAYDRKGQEYDWTRRLMAARPANVIRGNYKVLARTGALQNRGIGLARVKIEVNMSMAAFDAAWKESEEFIESVGEPSVGVALPADSIEDTRFTPSRVSRAATSKVAQAIKEELHKQHFRVVVLDHKKVLKATQLAFGKLEQASVTTLTEIALRKKADILIAGDAKTIGPERSTRTPGRVKFDWDASCAASMYWSDDASELGTLHAHGFGADKNVAVGQGISLEHAGENLAEAFLDKVFDQWSDWAFEGGTVTLTVTSANFAKARKLAKVVKNLSGVLKIFPQGGHGVATIQFRTKKTAYQIAEMLDDAELPGFDLEITDARLRTIWARVKN